MPHIYILYIHVYVFLENSMFGKSKKNKLFFSLHMQNITEGIMYSQMIGHNKTHIMKNRGYIKKTCISTFKGHNFCHKT